MTGAMYAAVSGLRTHMSALNVIGNNIANINTNAYKASRYVFNEELYTNVKTGANGTTTTGGVNPSQIGYGANVGTIDMDMSTKNYTPTGKPGDVCIDGDGFLLVGPKDLTINDKSDLSKFYLTRLGDLEIKEDGFLCDHEGNVVYGWMEVKPTDGNAPDGVTLDPIQGTYTSRKLTPLRVPMKDSNGEVVWPFETTTTGGGGGTGTDNSIDYNGVSDYKEGAQITGTGTGGNAGNNATVGSRGILASFSINKNGQLTGVTQEGKNITIGYMALGQVDNPNGVTHVAGRYFKALDGAGNLHVATMGELENLIPTANLPDGETKTAESALTGIPIEMTKNTELVPNGLESSGTELATEISNMIMMQRGYQANTRIITVTDSMLEELVNIKR